MKFRLAPKRAVSAEVEKRVSINTAMVPCSVDARPTPTNHRASRNSGRTAAKSMRSFRCGPTRRTTIAATAIWMLRLTR